MADLLRKIEAEKENVITALENLKEATARENKTTIELAAIATFLHNIYNGMENILKQVLKAKGLDVPRARTWHKDLLDLSASTGVIPQDLCDQLYEYLTFRHFFVHSYGFMIEDAPLQSLSAHIPDVWRRFIKAVESYCSTAGED